MIGIGIIFGIIFLDHENKKLKIKHNLEIDIYIGLIIAIIFSILGAKVFHIFYNRQNITINNIINSGMTFYGGLIFGIIIFCIFQICRKNQLLYMLNISIPSIILGHAFGRIGCFFGGCCFGKQTNSFIGVTFPKDSIPYNFYEGYANIFPTQLLESITLFILFIIIIKFVKYNFQLSTYFIFYGLFRFFIEFLRNDERGYLFTNIFSPSQIISIIFFFLGIILLITPKIKKGYIENRDN
jgi:phosphatidylglycerol:prolipoprotein diacylglycerol transferase